MILVQTWVLWFVALGRTYASAAAAPSVFSARKEAIFISNMGCNCVTVYDLNSSGDASPVAVIHNTVLERTFSFLLPGGGALDDPSGIAVDSAGEIYVSNMSGGAQFSGSIVVFQPGSNDSAKPIRRISGGHTGIHTIKSIAVGASGMIFTASPQAAGVIGPGISIYSPGSNGDAKPAGHISGMATRIQNANGVAVDSKGNVFVAGDTLSRGVTEDAVLIFAPDQRSNAPPSADITGPSTGLGAVAAIAVDSAGNAYVLNHKAGEQAQQTITVYRAGSGGNVAPVATIAGPKSDLANPDYLALGIAVDSDRNIYVAGGSNSPRRLDKVLVFAAGSNGDVPPRAIIEGPHTMLNGAYGIAIGPYPQPN